MTRRRFIALAVLALVLLVGALAAVVAATSGSGAEITVYTARLHYGEEEAFERFAERTGYDVRLFGGSGPDLNERLEAEGDLTQADLLITVDAANLADAKRRGLLRRIGSPPLERSVPARLRDPGDTWFGLTTRARTVMRSTERVPQARAPRTYAALGDPRWKGRLCLRTSDSVYNTSFVADLIAKDGRAATERMLRRWMANDPRILGSDVEVLEEIERGACDLGLTNSYYLGRELKENPRLPIAPAFVDGGGRGTHVNISGGGVTRHAKDPGPAQELLEFLAGAEAQALFAEINSEFPANPRAKLPARLREWQGFRSDPIDPDSGRLQPEAVKLLNEVGWR